MYALLTNLAGTVYATIGVHPCNAQSLSPTILTELSSLATCGHASGAVVAFGEIGLDYDRLSHCPAPTQLSAFRQQLEVAATLQLPLFLHSRAAHADFTACLAAYEARLPRRGVVHSFTGEMDEMKELVERGWDIGVNGCSLKTESNCEVVRAIPLERLQIETDGPWCEIRPSHFSWGVLGEMRAAVDGEQKAPKETNERRGKDETEKNKPRKNDKPQAKSEAKEEDPALGWGGGWQSVKKEKWVQGATVKGRNEPCFIGRVAWAVAGIKGVDVEVVCEAAWANSVRMFGVGVGVGDLRKGEGEGKERC